MRLVFLGTSAAQPTGSRGLSCICLVREDQIIMFDAGEAAQIAYMKSGLKWNKKMKILITHLHGDHCIGMLGLLQTMSMQKRTEQLEIFGPSGVEEFVAANIKLLNFGLSFPVLINTIKEGKVIQDGGFSIHVAKAEHTVTAYSYLLKEDAKPGRFNADQAKKLRVPQGVLWNKLQNGQSVTVDQNTIRPDQVLGKSRPGKKIGISGDTKPTKELEGFFEGCDYLVFDATFLDKERQRAQDTAHSTAKQAATLAKNANVKNLVLTHFSARYKNEAGHLEEARQVHDSVIAARDLMEIDVK